ncbi:IS630 transposase-related protein [Candidatus Protochlamydia amoebophila]|uniref:IS630 transposase-related protein n=1 Tax=Candidatus Protochlamydia amoebophila TaxID=362787 RepID=UPI0020160E76|nr:IS630 transposase-related protein [Candidatus Protochlamydia amoebophila]
MKEIAKEFNVDPSSIFYACKKLKITLKKRPYFTKKEMKKREEFKDSRRKSCLS